MLLSESESSLSSSDYSSPLLSLKECNSSSIVIDLSGKYAFHACNRYALSFENPLHVKEKGNACNFPHSNVHLDVLVPIYHVDQGFCGISVPIIVVLY
jgi:hypothetical protein